MDEAIESVIGEKPVVDAVEEVNNNPTPEEIKPKKERKKRKPMSAEHKAKALEALKKAREASKAKRQKNAYVKRLKKKEEEKAKDDEIKKQILADDDKDKEIAKLKKQLESLTLQDVVKKPTPKQQEPLPTIEEVNEVVPVVPTNKLPTAHPKNIEMRVEEPKEEKPSPPSPVSKPVASEAEEHKIEEKTTKIVRPQRRKPKRYKGMAKYGRR